MEIATLKLYRAIVPGTLIMLEGIPLYQLTTGEQITLFQGYENAVAVVGAVLAYVIGSLYNLFNSRSVFNRSSHEKITMNIKKRVLQIGRTRPLSDAERTELLEGRKLLDVFYNLIDSNESLKERARLVRNNGLIWSTCADLTVVGTCFACLYLPAGLLYFYPPFLKWGMGAAAVALLSGLLLHPLAEKRHIELSNDQLDFIDTNLQKEARSRIDAL